MKPSQFFRRLVAAGTPPRPMHPRRRLLSGRVVDTASTGRTWQELVAPAPAPTGGARTNPRHPSRKHDVGLTSSVAPADITHVVGGPSRRERRAAARGQRSA